MSKNKHPDPVTAVLRATVGPRLKVARKLLELTQEEAAEKIGISAEFYARMERGNALPSAETLPKLANALGVTVDHLIGADGPVPVVETVPEVARSKKESRQIDFIVDHVRDDAERLRLVTGLVKLCNKRERARARAEAGEDYDDTDVDDDDNIDDDNIDDDEDEDMDDDE